MKEKAMTIHETAKLVLVTLSLAVVSGSLAADDTVKIRGEVVGFQRGGPTEVGGEPDRITVRTRDGETRCLLLGEAGSCPGCVDVGDRIRARVMVGEPIGEPLRVRTMRVRRTGESLTFRNEAGELVHTRARRQEQSGADSVDAGRVRQQHRGQESGARGGGGRGRSGAGGGRR
jgi:hypothetical protein